MLTQAPALAPAPASDPTNSGSNVNATASPRFSASVCEAHITPPLVFGGVTVLPGSQRAQFTLSIDDAPPGAVVTFLSSPERGAASVTVTGCGSIQIGLAGDVQTAAGGTVDANGHVEKLLGRSGVGCAGLGVQAVLRLPEGGCMLSGVAALGTGSA